MQCDCGGILIEGRSCYRASGDHYSFILEDIPAYQCMRCGKILFNEETVDKIQILVKKIDRQTDEIIGVPPSVNLYDY